MQPSKLVVFGDSYSDPGNFYAIYKQVVRSPFDLIPSAPYEIGGIGGIRFSNGPTWVERLAEALGLQAAPAYALPNGTNYAVGGARARSGGNTMYGLSRQIDDYLMGDTTNIDALHIIAIGGNDVRDALEQRVSDGLSGRCYQILRDASYSIRRALDKLAARGVRQILVVNIFDVGDLPAVVDLGKQASGIATFMSIAFNTYLDDIVANFNDLPVQLFDMHKYGTSLMSQENLVTNTPVLRAGACFQDCDDFLFWDGIHFSRTGHALVAKQVYTTIMGVK